MKKARNTTANMLFRFLRGSKLYFFAAILASAVSITANFLVPQIIGFTVDSVIGSEKMKLPIFVLELIDSVGGRDFLRSNLYVCVICIIAAAALSALFNYISRMNIGRGTGIFTKNMRDVLFSHTQRLGFDWHTRTQTGDIIQRCTSDVEVARDFVSKQLIEVLRTVILLIIALSIMFAMSVPMALLVAAFIPIVLTYTMFFYGRISSQFLLADEAEGRLMIQVQENLTGVRVVRAFGRERHETEVFDKKNDEFTDSWIKLGGTLGLYWGAGDAVSYSQLLAVVSVGAYLAAVGKLSLGDLLIFISYTQTITGPIRQMGRVLSDMSKAGVSFKRIQEILDAPAEEAEPGAKKPPMDGDIEFSGVTFGYEPGIPVLKDLSFKIEAGSTLGVLGSTGSGKSTITYVLDRLFELEPGCGKITIGGVDIKEIDRAHLRRNISLVLQEPFLFSKTIGENIAIAVDGAGQEEIEEAAKIAAVHDDITDFPLGYDTMVGERGVTLSGGQKQRVAIARALITKAPVMVFDDSMSAVDTETDAAIRDALRENTGGSTVILISHRISTLMQADRILVLEDGRNVEFGTHHELVQRGGIYSRIYNIQSGAGGDEQ